MYCIPSKIADWLNVTKSCLLAQQILHRKLSGLKANGNKVSEGAKSIMGIGPFA